MRDGQQMELACIAKEKHASTCHKRNKLMCKHVDRLSVMEEERNEQITDLEMHFSQTDNGKQRLIIE